MELRPLCCGTDFARGPRMKWHNSQLEHFIKIDEKVMHSLVGYLEKGWSTDAFVKIVEADWEPLCDESDCGKGFYKPIQDCTEMDVGWMHIAPEMVNSKSYYALDGYEPEWDDMFYQSPPHVVLW